MKWNERIGRKIKLHDLHVFVTFTELGGMGKAAERLAVSQPSVSKAIADLENALGVKLLDRTTKGVETTAYGRALLRRGLGAFDELRQVASDIEAIGDPSMGEIRIGCPEAIAAGLLPAVIDRFARRRPRVVVKVVASDNMAPAFRPLRERETDFLLGRILRPFLEADLEAEWLFDESLRVAAGGGSVWARRRKLTLAELVDVPWVLFPEESWIGIRVADAFRAAGLSLPKCATTSFSVQFCTNLLATNRFVAALPGLVLRLNAQRLGLKVLALDLPVASWPVGIVTLKKRTMSPAAQSFIACIRETLGEAQTDSGLR